ncbi:FHA domain-containing protein [Microseira wollei]|uniref:FHA domain containing protein n=1 Tax=Microseira wollei NIES-4236 TaxID=2530354 RepID=A0AAV3XN06_9CYAN|nr:FHA domain-containing protein [Microseira wollei]GET43071.1 FHA domain containing protein [Microseira wollei NIES-4236]
MNQLTLEWQDAGQKQTQTISEQQASKNPGTVRIGRDPVRCDIVLSHPTVSGLHIEIYFNAWQQRFYLRNLRETNPPWVDGGRLNVPEVALNQGTTIYLGETQLKVTGVSIVESNVPPTVLVSPHAHSTNQGQFPAIPHRNNATVPPAVPGANQTYGLQCPKCQRISPYERLDIGCPWCGTSLAAAASVLIAPKQ